MAANDAFFFAGRSARRLFAAVHRPETGRPSDLGVVFCHPLGEEKQKSYRCYVEFGRHLADAGYSVLRFDGYGFGDSDGDVGDATVGSLCDDTLDAIEQLSDVQRIVLVGVRFGATIAALVGVRDPRVVGTVLCSPIVSGERYRDVLLRGHQMAAITRGKQAGRRDELLLEIERRGFLEVDAQPLSAAFLGELVAIDLVENTRSYAGARLVTALAVEDGDRAEVLRLVDACRARGNDVQHWTEERDFWSSKSLYDGYQPIQLFERTAAWLSRLARK